jgi:hypothetical protein
MASKQSKATAHHITSHRITHHTSPQLGKSNITIHRTPEPVSVFRPRVLHDSLRASRSEPVGPLPSVYVHMYVQCGFWEMSFFRIFLFRFVKPFVVEWCWRSCRWIATLSISPQLFARPASEGMGGYRERNISKRHCPKSTLYVCTYACVY